jgi:hypothetical protein
VEKKIVNMSKWAAFAQKINQQIGHFTVPHSVIGFNAPYWDWVSQYVYIYCHRAQAPTPPELLDNKKEKNIE